MECIFKPCLVFLSETKIGKNVAESLRWKMGLSNAFGVDCVGKSGGLCLYWRNDKMDFSLVSFSQNHICRNIKSEGVEPWRFIGIYRWPETSSKGLTFKMLRKLFEESFLPTVIGDILMRF